MYMSEVSKFQIADLEAQTRSDILQGQALFRRDKQHLTKDVFCLSLSIKNKKVPK